MDNNYFVVGDKYPRLQTFENVLRLAKEGCRSDTDRRFVDGMSLKYRKFAAKTYISRKQLSWLHKLAGC